VRGRPRKITDGESRLIYMDKSTWNALDKIRGTLSRSAFIRYTLEEVVKGGKPDLCSIELSHLKKENIELINKVAKYQNNKPKLVKDLKHLEPTAKIRFIELLTEDTEQARKFKPPKKGDTGFIRWQDRARFMVDKYKTLCGYDMQPYEWISLIEHNPILKMGEEDKT